MKRVNLENGNYALIYYYDDNNNSVDETLATKCIVSRFDKDNKLIDESWAALVPKIDENEIPVGSREYPKSSFKL